MRPTLPLTISCLVLWSTSSAQETCFAVDEEGFENSADWTHVGSQTDVDITNGAMVWNGAHNQVYDRWWRPLNWAVADDCFKAEFTVTVQPNPSGSGVGAVLLALTAGSQDPLYFDGSQNFYPTDQNGLVVDIASDGTAEDNMDSWYFRMVEAEGENRHYQPTSECIFLDASISTYYAVFERISATVADLHVYTDADHTVLHGASSFGIHSSVVGLNTMQAGVSTGGWVTRQFNGTLDDISICHCENTIGITEVAPSGPMLELQPIAPGLLSVRSRAQSLVHVRVMDVQGREVQAFQLNPRAEARMIPLTAGIFLVTTLEDGLRDVQRVVVP